MILFSLADFLNKNNFGNVRERHLWRKKPEHILKNGLDFPSRNDASSNPRIRILKFLLDFCPEMTLAQCPEIVFCPEFTDRG